MSKTKTENKATSASPVNALVMWLKTIGKPKERCKFFGHKMKTERIQIKKRGGGYSAVITKYNAKRDYCKRCLKGYYDKDEKLYDLEKLRSFTGCSMPSDMWDELDRIGYLEY